MVILSLPLLFYVITTFTLLLITQFSAGGLFSFASFPVLITLLLMLITSKPIKKPPYLTYREAIRIFCNIFIYFSIKLTLLKCLSPKKSVLKKIFNLLLISSISMKFAPKEITFALLCCLKSAETWSL